MLQYRISVEGNHQFGITEILVGAPLPKLAYDLCRLKLSPQVAWETLLTGKIYSPQQALQKGLIDKLVPKEKLIQAAIKEATVLGPDHLDAYITIKKRLNAPFVERFSENECQQVIQEFADTLEKPGSKRCLQRALQKLKSKM